MVINKFVNCVKRGVKSGFHKVMDSRPVRCCVGVALGIFASTCKALAQAGGGAGYEAGKNAISQASEQIAQYVPIATKLCYAIAGVVAIVGAISVYVKMNNEEQDVKKSIMMIIGACVFLIAAAQALPLFFGIEDGVITGF
jgi:hypothetical protein